MVTRGSLVLWLEFGGIGSYINPIVDAFFGIQKLQLSRFRNIFALGRYIFER